MAYYIDAGKVTLDALLLRIRDTDLVPSRASLLDNIEERFNKLKINGVNTLAELRKAVKTPKSIGALAEKSGVGGEYLTLLRREVEGYFPKAFPLRDFTWLDESKTAALENRGYKNTALLYDAIDACGKTQIFGAGDGDAFAEELSSLAGLTRIQWVSPLAAKMLYEAGYKNAATVAAADGAELTEQLEQVNSGGKYFKGKIGRRDVQRLIKAAAYLEAAT